MNIIKKSFTTITYKNVSTVHIFYESLFQKPYNYIYCPDILDQMRQVSKFLSRQRSTFRPWVWHHTRAGRENGKNPRLALFTQHLSPMVRWHGRHVAAWLCTMSLLAEIRTGPSCDPEIRGFEMNLNWSSEKCIF